MRSALTPQQLEFLRQQYPLLSLEDLTAAFNTEFGCSKTRDQIHWAVKNHKILRGNRKRIGFLCKLLTMEQDQFLREHYPHMPRKEVTAALNARFGLSLQPGQIGSYAKNHGIKSGRTGHFPKGNVPFNAGTKGFMSANRTSFAPGAMPHTYVPVGSTSVDGEGYHRTKVGDPNVWKYTHRMIWEEAHGPIPKTHAVVFVDGDKTNLRLDNLELITRGELSMRNKHQLSSAPQELRPLVKSLAKLRLTAGAARRRASPGRTA